MTRNKIFACHEHRKRLIMGTEFPIETFITFEPWERCGYRTKPWKITVELCNGVPEKSVRFKTKKDAMNYFSKYIKE